MRIANPIYDVVFKYLMEDRESAVLLLSEIIGEDIAELAFHPQESTAEIAGRNRCITVYRLDFAAKIRLKEGGYRKVIIEIQKAKFSTDIMRFRRYLGEQYRNRENVYHDDNGNKKALPIISVYFLGHRLSGTDRAVIKVKRAYYDGITEEKLSCREEFIESLTHDSFVVQIPSLKQPYRSRLEKLLSIFDQHRRVSDHILEIEEEDYPEEYRQLIRRLIRAAAEKQVMDTMDAEDDILEELENMERTIEEKNKTIKEHREKLEENKKEMEENKKEMEEKDRIIKELMEKMKSQS
ncbi:PD-(D/E)XK nuclease family transposase [Candidatus Electrothrix laxa]